MKKVAGFLSILLVFGMIFGLCACHSDYDRDETTADASNSSEPTEKEYLLEGEEGCYYGTYTETDYNGEQTQGNRNYFVFAYNEDYYLVRAKEPAEELEVYKKIGPEEYYKQKFSNSRLTVEKSEFDTFFGVSLYTVKSRINDEQYLLTDYKIDFDHYGKMDMTWETKNIYKGREEPYGTGTYTGNRK
ncbi:MAG: hypothetical protein IJU01_04200 [Lachnospiraceae bacterium]|nr:hypothetical protein [Lachnospiraceae bacterium]